MLREGIYRTGVYLSQGPALGDNQSEPVLSSFAPI